MKLGGGQAAVSSASSGYGGTESGPDVGAEAENLSIVAVSLHERSTKAAVHGVAYVAYLGLCICILLAAVMEGAHTNYNTGEINTALY